MGTESCVQSTTQRYGILCEHNCPPILENDTIYPKIGLRVLTWQVFIKSDRLDWRVVFWWSILPSSRG